MWAYLGECSTHAEILADALAEVKPWQPFTVDSARCLDKKQVQILDQLAYRFAKLQDLMGQKVLPMLLELTEEPIAPDATFAEKLNWLEKMGVLPSATEWKELRAARNAIAHEYPDEPDLRASAINRFLDGAIRLTALYRHIRGYLQERFPMLGRVSE